MGSGEWRVIASIFSWAHIKKAGVPTPSTTRRRDTLTGSHYVGISTCRAMELELKETGWIN